MFKTIKSVGSGIVGVGRSVKDGGVSVYNKAVTLENVVLIGGTLFASLNLYLIYLGVDNARLEHKILKKAAK